MSAECCCYILVLVLTCFHLTKGRATYFRSKTLVASFLHLMVLLFKVLSCLYYNIFIVTSVSCTGSDVIYYRLKWKLFISCCFILYVKNIGYRHSEARLTTANKTINDWEYHKNFILYLSIFNSAKDFSSEMDDKMEVSIWQHQPLIFLIICSECIISMYALKM